MATLKFGPWAEGLNNISSENELSEKELFVAENVDIDGSGHVSAATGRVYVMPGTEDYISGIVLNGVSPTGGDTTVDENDERSLVEMPSLDPDGYQIAWRGRIIMTKGDALVISEPLAYGVYDELRGYVQFPERIIWLAALPEGIYVGLVSSVQYLKGVAPSEWTVSTVSGPTWECCSAVMDASNIASDITKGAPQVAVWFGRNGFEIGLPSGEVMRPQASRVFIPEVKKGRLIVGNDRLTVIQE